MFRLKSLRLLTFWQATLALIVILGSAYGVYDFAVLKTGAKPADAQTSTQQVAVRYSNVSQTLSVSGSLAYSNTQQLSFGAAGTIGEVDVQVGGSVTKGQTLAKLDNASILALQQALVQAQTAVNTAQANLATAQQPYTASDIAQAQLAVTNDQIAVNTAQANLATAQQPYSAADIAQAQAAILTAQQNLTNTSLKAQTDIASAQYAIYTALNTYNANPTTANWNNYQAAQVNLSIVQANAAQSIQSAQSNVTQAQTTLANMLAPPDPLNIQQKQQLLVVAQNNLAIAQTTLANMLAPPDPLNIQQKQQLLVVAQNNLATAQTTLANMLAPPDPLNIQQKQYALQSAQAAVGQVQQQLKSTTLVAPFAGIATSVNIQVGQAVGANTDAVDMVDPSSMVLTASVSELDIANVKVGQTATVNVSAISGRSFTGTVTNVANTATTSQGVVSFKVTITVTVPSGVQLLAGMSSTASVIVKQDTHVLVVPNQAVGGTLSNPTVTVLVNGQPQVRSVTTGLSDSSNTEITQGLQEGDIVLITTTVSSSRTTTSTSTRATTTSTRQVPGGVIPGIP